MKTLLTALFAAASLATVPMPAFALQLAMACDGPDVPEAWKRPGGYCAQANSPNSLIPSQGGPPVSAPCGLGALETARGARLDVAGEVTCCTDVRYEFITRGGRAIVAQIDPCYDPCVSNTRLELPALKPGDRLAIAVC